MWRNQLAMLNDFNRLRRDMNHLLGAFGYEDEREPGRTGGFPAVNVWENPESVLVEAELPGVKQENLHVYAAGNELTIKGERRPLEGEKLSYHRQERSIGTFARMMTLPCDVNPDKIEATLKDGVLRIELPKAVEARPRQIAVKTA